MWSIETHGHQERFFTSLPPLLDCPFRYLVVSGLLIDMIMRSAFSPKIRLLVGKFPADIWRTIQIPINFPLQLSVVSVGYFPTANHPVSVLFEVPMKDHGILQIIFRSNPLHWLVSKKRRSAGTVKVPAGTLGIEAMQKTRSRRTALGCITMGICKQNATCR